MLLLQPLWSQLNFESILEHFLEHLYTSGFKHASHNTYRVFFLWLRTISFHLINLSTKTLWDFPFLRFSHFLIFRVSQVQQSCGMTWWHGHLSFHGPRFQPPSFQPAFGVPSPEPEVGSWVSTVQTPTECAWFLQEKTGENKGFSVQPFYPDIFLHPKISGGSSLIFVKGMATGVVRVSIKLKIETGCPEGQNDILLKHLWIPKGSTWKTRFWVWLNMDLFCPSYFLAWKKLPVIHHPPLAWVRMESVTAAMPGSHLARDTEDRYEEPWIKRWIFRRASFISSFRAPISHQLKVGAENSTKNRGFLKKKSLVKPHDFFHHL